MNKKEFLDLVNKYLSGNCSRQEKELVERFCMDMENGAIDIKPQLFASDKRRIFNHIMNNIAPVRRRTIFQKPVFRWLSGIVAAVLIFFVATFYWLSVKESASLPMLTFKTKIGEQKLLTLSDGSQIRLNAKSWLKCPQTFADDKRLVELEGEAFFEVTRDVTRPFIIMTSGLQTKVLGTSFNIKSYADDKNVIVGVVTGKVKVSTLDKTQSNILVPGQMSVLDKNIQHLSQNSFDIKQMLAWQTGVLFFDNTSLDEVTKMLERYYDVSFHFNETHRNKHISGQIKLTDINTILKTLSFLSGSQFGQTGTKQIIVRN